MPAYVQHRDIESALIVCPNCLGLPVYVRDVAPHWGVAKIDFIYECSDCGAENQEDRDKAGTTLDMIVEWSDTIDGDAGAQCFHAGASRATPGRFPALTFR